MDRSEEPLILLTGAKGFIGSATLGALAEAGMKVRAAVRRPMEPSPTSVSESVRFVPCNLDDATQVRGAVSGVSAVVHTAYGNEAAMVAQCETLLAAMTEANVGNLVYISSIAIYGDRDGTVHESDTALRPLDGYALAKQQCEELVHKWAAGADGTKQARRAIVLRPGIVYGTNSRFWIDKLVERFKFGGWGTLGQAGEGIAALVHVDDAACAILTSCQALSGERRPSLPPVVTAHVVGPESLTWNRYFTSVAEKFKIAPLPTVEPSQLAVHPLVAVAAKILRRLGLPGLHAAALAPTDGELSLFRQKAEYSRENAKSQLGFAAHVALAEGLARTIIR